MRCRCNPRASWIGEHPIASVLVGAGALTAIALVLTRDGRTSSTPASPASSPASPAPSGWSYLSQERIWLSPGWRYRAVVSLPWYVPSSVATPAKAKAYAEDKGFVDVVAFDKVPPGWPATKGDLWVEATWNKPGQYYDRPSALEHVWVRI